MRTYEMVTIVDPEMPDEVVPETNERLSQLIKNKGGTVTKMQRWGRRRLSYPIKHHTEGHYVLTQFELDPSLALELDAEIRVSEDVLRHMILRTEDQTAKPQIEASEAEAEEPRDEGEGKGVC